MARIDRYMVRMRGDNFLLNLDGDHAKFRFYATRIIKTVSAEDAERRAVIHIHQELNLNDHIVKNTPDAPRVTVENTEKLGQFRIIRKKNVRGFTYLKEEEATADQCAPC